MEGELGVASFWEQGQGYIVVGGINWSCLLVVRCLPKVNAFSWQGELVGDGLSSRQHSPKVRLHPGPAGQPLSGEIIITACNWSSPSVIDLASEQPSKDLQEGRQVNYDTLSRSYYLPPLGACSLVSASPGWSYYLLH